MANYFGFELQGDRAAVRRLRQYPEKLSQKGLRRAARVAMKIVLDDARAAARAFDDPNTPQQIWRLIVIKTGRMKKGTGVRMRVGIAGGAKAQRAKDFPWYWRLLEFGTERMAARPFMRPALDKNAKAVADRFSAELEKEIDKLDEAGE